MRCKSEVTPELLVRSEQSRASQSTAGPRTWWALGRVCMGCSFAACWPIAGRKGLMSECWAGCCSLLCLGAVPAPPPPKQPSASLLPVLLAKLPAPPHPAIAPRPRWAHIRGLTELSTSPSACTEGGCPHGIPPSSGEGCCWRQHTGGQARGGTGNSSGLSQELPVPGGCTITCHILHPSISCAPALPTCLGKRIQPLSEPRWAHQHQVMQETLYLFLLI